MKNRYVKLFIITLLLFLGIGLVACGGEVEPEIKDIAPDTIEIYEDSGKTKSIYNYGDTEKLEVDISPSNASFEVIWSTSDEKIATVDSEGNVTIVGGGEFTITATSKVDANVKAEWKKQAYDNRDDTKDISDTKEYLDYLFPENYEVEGFVELPREYSKSKISWTSSNPSIFAIDGSYNRQQSDERVRLTATISCGKTTDKWERDIIVGNINDVKMKTINSGQLVMMYVYTDSTLTPYELKNVDIINHAFALINPTTHELELSGISHSVSNLIKARSYGIRVVLSIGGWGADGFSQACATEETRTTFINSIISAVNKYGYDGVDLDWEYPTSTAAGIVASSKDKANFTAFIKALRSALNAIRPNMLLTAAVASETTYYDVKSLNQYLDYWNIMSYDFSSKRTGETARHDEPLNRTKTAIEAFISAGATPSKIVLGVTYRAVKYKVSDLGGNYGIGQKMMANRIDVDYKELVSSYLDNPKYKYYYDSTNGIAILYTQIKVDGYYEVLSFEDETSLNARGAYIRTKGLAGMMSWELGMDDNDNTILKLTVKALR